MAAAAAVTSALPSAGQLAVYGGAIAGAAVALIIGLMFGMRLSSTGVAGVLRRGGLLVITYNIDDNTVSVYPAETRGENLVVLRSAIPSILIKSPSDVPLPIRGSNAKAFFAVKSGVVATLVRPEVLAHMGVAKIAVGDAAVTASGPNSPRAVAEIVSKLATMSEEKEYRVALAPDAEIGIALSPRAVAVAVGGDVVEGQHGVIEAANLMYTTGRSVRNMLERIFSVAPSGPSPWARTAVIVALVAMVILLAIVAILHPPSATTVTHVVTSTSRP